MARPHEQALLRRERLRLSPAITLRSQSWFRSRFMTTHPVIGTEAIGAAGGMAGAKAPITQPRPGLPIFCIARMLISAPLCCVSVPTLGWE
jgi:hypothetical protein